MGNLYAATPGKAQALRVYIYIFFESGMFAFGLCMMYECSLIQSSVYHRLSKFIIVQLRGCKFMQGARSVCICFPFHDHMHPKPGGLPIPAVGCARHPSFTGLGVTW